jgi:outer membrane protein insertion porin family
MEGETFGREEELRQLILLQPGRPIRATCRKRRTSASPTASRASATRSRTSTPTRRSTARSAKSPSPSFVDPGKRAYVRHMTISGNTITRDEVIRREFRQFESSWYDPTG